MSLLAYNKSVKLHLGTTKIFHYDAETVGSLQKVNEKIALPTSDSFISAYSLLFKAFNFPLLKLHF